jgi:hypothetical protein
MADEMHKASRKVKLGMKRRMKPPETNQAEIMIGRRSMERDHASRLR